MAVALDYENKFRGFERRVTDDSMFGSRRSFESRISDVTTEDRGLRIRNEEEGCETVK